MLSLIRAATVAKFTLMFHHGCPFWIGHTCAAWLLSILAADTVEISLKVPFTLEHYRSEHLPVDRYHTVVPNKNKLYLNFLWRLL